MSKTETAIFQRLVQIAHEHIAFSRRNPQKASEVANQMGVTVEVALAGAIADQVIEEFQISHRKGDRPCLRL